MAQKLAEKKLTNLKNNYRLFYEDNKELILNLYALRVSVPDDLLGIIKVSLQEKAYEEIEKTLKGEKNIWKDIKKVTKRCKINLSTKVIQHKLQEFIEKGLRDLKISFSSSLCRSINRALTIYYSIFMTYDLWEAQNLLWEILSLAKKEDKMPPSGIIQLGKTLGFRMDQ
jgi:predicted adenine nucleotide alpha hydrolase (AANH) superfamily ATPase